MFVSTKVYGVSCDSKNVIDILLRILKGEITHVAMMGTNHNEKNIRRQYLVGGRLVTSIGSELINRGLVKAAGINQGTWRVKNWEENHIVLCLCSANTVFKTFHLKNVTQDPVTIAITCVHL